MNRVYFHAIAVMFSVSEHSCSVTIGGGGSAGAHNHHYLGAFILGGIGLLLFYGGFQNYRKLRLLQDSPRMPVRSLAMGRVHIRGTAIGEQRLISPLTHCSCFYYVVRIERWERRPKGGGQWSMCLRHVDHVPFFLKDETGRVLVNPHQAELDLPQTFRAETGVDASPVQTIDPSRHCENIPSASGLVGYLSQTHGRIQTETAAQHDSGFKRLANLERSLTLLPPTLSAEDLGQHLRFTEECLLPDHEYNILGNCAENPNPRDSTDRNMIVRGKDDPTYLISGKSEMVIEKETLQSSLLMVLIGGALLVGGAMLFLSNFDLW